MVLKRKSEGIAALKQKVEYPSIQEITMLDWYAMSATIGLIYADDDPEAAAEKIFDLAEALMAEREKRI
jgi:hypothetical protein